MRKYRGTSVRVKLRSAILITQSAHSFYSFPIAKRGAQRVLHHDDIHIEPQFLEKWVLKQLQGPTQQGPRYAG